MLRRLENRLLLAAVCTLMLLASALFGLSLWHSINTQREADILYIQRMASLIVFALEANADDASSLLADYEDETGIASRLTASDGTLRYETPGLDSETLLHEARQSLASTPADTTENAASVQGGAVNLEENGEHWLLIPATVQRHDGARDNLTLFYAQASLWSLIVPELPRFALLWLATLAFVILASRLLLRRAFAPAHAMLARQKAFVAAASHELKSPLAVIMANTDTLDEEPLSSTARQRLAVIDSECSRLAQLADDLLLLAANDAGQTPAKWHPLDPDALLIELYETYMPLCNQNSQHLTLTLPDEPLPSVNSDASRLHQILTILLDNAMSHTPEGTHITLSAQATSKALTFAVSDNGPGIAPVDQPHIFERFYRADTARTNKNHSGLGLAIAQTLSAQLGASLTYSTASTGGAIFTLTLPLDAKNPSIDSD